MSEAKPIAAQTRIGHVHLKVADLERTIARLEGKGHRT
jgi:catechol-2,3-dioxygenase